MDAPRRSRPPRTTKPHSPQISRHERRPRSAILAADADHRAPAAALLAPVGPRPLREAQRRSRGRALHQRRRPVHARRQRRAARRDRGALARARLRPVVRRRRARTPTAAWASSGWPCRRSCRRCCPPSRSGGGWRARRGGAGSPPRARARRCATPSAELGLEAVISIIDPANERSIRVAQKLGMRRGADHLHPRTGRRLSAYEIFSHDAAFSPEPS